jgi:hypothetical protein
MTPTWMSFMVIPAITFMGFLFSLITSIFLKKQARPFDEAMSEINDNTTNNNS